MITPLFCLRIPVSLAEIWFSHSHKTRKIIFVLKILSVAFSLDKFIRISKVVVVVVVVFCFFVCLFVVFLWGFVVVVVVCFVLFCFFCFIRKDKCHISQRSSRGTA